MFVASIFCFIFSALIVVALVIYSLVSNKTEKQTKPQQSKINSTPFSIDDNDTNIDLSLMSESDKEMFITVQKGISNLTETYNKAIYDLGDTTVEDVEFMYKYRRITKEQYEEFRNAVESLTFMIETLPITINDMKNKQLELINKYK